MLMAHRSHPIRSNFRMSGELREPEVFSCSLDTTARLAMELSRLSSEGLALIIWDKDWWYAWMRLTGGVAKYAGVPPSYPFIIGSHLR
jgi:hypothetical protein